jgi:hypothetical protein
MNSTQQFSANSVIERVVTPVIAPEKIQYQLRIYSPYPQVQVVIFSKVKSETCYLTIKEVENLVNLAISRIGLNPNFIVWIEHSLSQHESLADDIFSLVTFDWYNGHTTNPRWVYIQENWYLYWLDSLHLEYITV